ncbi:MAG: aromatase/cyclase [Acidaminococcaceae bacterium]|nr:aromatase/cyclase [Acidaminococcaceae bacterium]
MPFVESKALMQGKKEDIYDIIAKMEDYPLFMESLKSVKVLERGENFTISTWDSDVDGRRIAWTERDEFDPKNFSITYKQTQGDLKKMEGAWNIKDTDQGVEVSLSVDFEFGIPMISGLLNPILKKKVRENSENMLEAIKLRVEK